MLYKNLVLLIASFFFYAWGEPRFCILLALNILIGYLGGRSISWIKQHSPGSDSEDTTAAASGGNLPCLPHLPCPQWLLPVSLWFFLLLSLSGLFTFKYYDFFVGSITAAFGASTGISLPLLKLALPIGISFYTFQILSYLVDVYRGKYPAERFLINFATYISFFPQLIAGPIVRYGDVRDTLAGKLPANSSDAGDLCSDDFSNPSQQNDDLPNQAAAPVQGTVQTQGLQRFLTGLAKKVLLADSFAACVTALGGDQLSKGIPDTLALWLIAVAFTLQIYFDFSGYSDMAIGMGRFFGFSFPENFDYPYISKSVTEFWRRWHMTLGGWFRDYVYIPLGGNRVPFIRWIFNVTVVWFLSGLWHGASWNFVLWGLFYALFLLLEKLFLGKLLQKLPRFVGHLYTMFLVVIGFVLFRTEDLGLVLESLKGMFLPGTIVAGSVTTEEVFTTSVSITAHTIYELQNYLGLFLIGIIAMTPVPRKVCSLLHLEAKPLLRFLWYALLLLLITAFLVSGSFQAFLYFRF